MNATILVVYLDAGLTKGQREYLFDMLENLNVPYYATDEDGKILSSLENPTRTREYKL